MLGRWVECDSEFESSGPEVLSGPLRNLVIYLTAQDINPVRADFTEVPIQVGVFVMDILIGKIDKRLE